MTENTFLIIGLGNPGREYLNTRHNFGFMMIDRIAVRLNARGMKVQSKAIVLNTRHEDKKLILPIHRTIKLVHRFIQPLRYESKDRIRAAIEDIR